MTGRWWARLIAVTTILAATALPAGAQGVPGVPDAAVGTALASVGTATTDDGTAAAWVAADGVVVTSDLIADTVGASATFALFGSEDTVTCYLAVHRPEAHLAVLRCGDLSGDELVVAPKYPSPGTAVFNLRLDNDDNPSVQGGQIIANNVEFMGSRRLQFSFLVAARDDSSSGSTRAADAAVGTPVFNGEGQVVSMLLIAPEAGGAPLGLSPTQISDAVNEALPLPDSFRAAALRMVAKRSLIPGGIGLVAGLVWGLWRRTGSVTRRAAGLMAAGVMAAIAYSVFTLVVVGPQSLLS